MEAAKPIFTKVEGLKWAADFLESLHTGFAANDMSANEAMTADTVEWKWSGGIKSDGPKSKAEYFGVLAGSWQMVCSQMLYSNVHTTVDPATGEICLSFDVTLIMDGRGAVPITEASTFQGQNCFKLTLNAEHKLVKFVGTWDSTDPKMMAAFGAVLAAKEA